ncbi:MAG TPA: DJ-1/PfpI family protein [Candidatus Eisenbacteria bacterium]|nr:DJ-1/PfpI family protein [Candidatus Eisenbacteria bacterium]
MRARTLLATGALLAGLGAGSAIVMLPPSDTRDAAAAPPAIPEQEQQALIAALKPPKHAVPVVAVLGLNRGTETTDYVVPYGVLRASGLAEVVALATEPGRLHLMPALTLDAGATIADFDARHPDGADYVIVPAMHDPSDPTVASWIRSQAAKGATIVGICAGARVLAHAGLLRGRSGTTHWYELAALRNEEPRMRWARNRRYVADRGVVTTTGVTASIPVSLAIVEAIGGRAPAEALAHEIGVERWDAAHDSDAFRLDRRSVLTAAGNTLAFWSHETVGIPVASGVDEIALALTADAYSRTYRSRALAVAADSAPLQTRRGLTIVPDETTSDHVDVRLDAVPSERPATVLDAALRAIAGRYGSPTATFVALQLEYPRVADARGD